jgi:hypothetical protein
MLIDSDRERVKAEFSADDSQVERDHLISHILAELSTGMRQQLKFYGGTALSRSYLPHGRLSEDVDLIAVGPRPAIAGQVLEVLTRGLAREFGRPSFSPLLTEARSVTPIVMKVPSGPQVQLQLLPSNHYPAWPFHVMTLQDRYSDCGPASLSIPTRDSFVAWKTTAFMDRRASRDLWDLAALAELDAFTPEAARLFTQFGLLRSLPSDSTIPPAPDEPAWERDLAHQTRLAITAEQARTRVVDAWSMLDV